MSLLIGFRRDSLLPCHYPGSAERDAVPEAVEAMAYELAGAG